ncbi:MAG: ABATE domain-containing protein, partial [Candidatus Rokuibacteriota bacterium]
MATVRREVIRVGEDLAIDFANTLQGLQSWSALVDFLEVRSAVTRREGAELRALGEADARRCAVAFDQGVRFRETVRAMLGAMAAGRPLRAQWVAEVNRALAWGAGADRLVRQDAGWRLHFAPDLA